MLDPAIATALAADDQHIAIAGAGGWIGLATLDLLERALGDDLPRRVSCYGSATRLLTLRSGRQVRQTPLADLKSLEAGRIWLLHFAFQTKDRAEAMSEADYRAVNDAISATVLDAARTLPVEALFVASSGAATRASDPLASPAMRLYGQMKRDDEDRFAAWAQDSGRRAVIGRIFNITGPYINKHQAYAIANFILDALADRPIEVRAPRQVFRAYVAIRELMSLVFALMARTDGGVTRFDTGGQELELEAVARAVAQAVGGGGTSVNRAFVSDPAADRYVGDSAAYAALLARYGIEPISLDQQIVETAADMRLIAAAEPSGLASPEPA
ncbi:NAD-dependent epimerase/dehydratase family protein [Sphingobium sp. CAP-1]|uniref:NAD-dependent epimerase/dehydratase family protein n=1 Tax=Sphingobium sp. CAP-1 TaxID=2676077 RepID=UPI0018AD1E43|nr:NAD(P)-dependent oxidoreductase [Sphingobium sp. CAP-1]